MLNLSFSGHFLCRLATNPDPFDEPRGRAGLTRAYPGEPDFDRAIYFNSTQGFARKPGGEVMRPVRIFATDPSFAGLERLTVNLDPVDGRKPSFQGRDGIITEPHREFIAPLRVSLNDGKHELIKIDYAHSAHRTSTLAVTDDEWFDQAGLCESLLAEAKRIFIEWGYTFIPARRHALEKMLADSSDLREKTILVARLKMLNRANYLTDWQCQKITYTPSPTQQSNASCIESNSYAHWPLTLCFFGFDFDLLGGICVGQLTVPCDAAEALLQCVAQNRPATAGGECAANDSRSTDIAANDSALPQTAA